MTDLVPSRRSACAFALVLAGSTLLFAETSMASDHSDSGIGDDHVQLQVEVVAVPEAGRIDIAYTASNRGAVPLVLHNRGSAIGSRVSPDRRLPVLDESGGLTVEAMPIPAPEQRPGRTGPYQPAVSLAMRLDPGQAYRGTVTVNPPEGTRRIRFCLGVSAYSAQDFPVYAAMPEGEDGVALLRSPWREGIDDLVIACSAWHELAG